MVLTFGYILVDDSDTATAAFSKADHSETPLLSPFVSMLQCQDFLGKMTSRTAINERCVTVSL